MSFATFCFSEQKYSFVINTFIMYIADPSPFIVLYIIYYYYTIVLHVRCKFRETFYNNSDKVYMYVKFYDAELDLPENILDVYNR